MTHLDQTHFDASLKERLRSLGFRSPSCIQSVVWPAVLTGRNVVAVATPHTGKTLAYLIPLVSRMLTETDYLQLPSGCGPLMLILTSTWQGAHRIYEQVNLLVEEDTKCPKCCVLYAGGSEDGKEIPIINGCDILVATPHSFLRFLNNYERLIVNMYRCCHLVLDDGERLLEKYTAEVTAVLEEFRECQKQRQSCLHISQIIVCSTMWTSGLNWFLRTYIAQQTPLVIFSSFSEAAIYAAVPTVTCYVEPHSQNDALLKIVKANIGRKVVVCAAGRETAIAAHHLLVSQDLYSLLLHDELPGAKISEVSSEWTSEHAKVDMPILVIQDKVLPLTNIRDAAVLVHYDIPELSQFNFGFRYSCIADHMRSFRDEEDFYTPEGPVAHMILSSNNRSISVQLMEFLNRLGSKVPDGLAQLATEEQMQVSSSAEQPLCPNLKAFGRCERQSSESHCSYRHHILPKADHAPCWSYLPSQGSVRISITKVTSASHFYAQILQQRNMPSGSANGNKLEMKDNLELQEAMSLLSEYFSNVENRVPLDEKATPTVGQVYGLEASADQFERVLVTSATSSTPAPASVTVTHLDYGGQSTVSTTRLFPLPPRLAMIRPLAVEVYCCGMQPPDNDLSWTFQADFRAHNLFFRKELVGEIVLRLGNTLWLDGLVFQEKLRFVDTRVSLRNLKTTLVKEGFASNNPSHMERLRKMAADAGVTVPPHPAEVEGQSSVNSGLDATLKRPCTTHLDTMDYDHVYLWKVASPSHFYVQPCKFIKSLDDLEKDIENAVQRQKLKKLKSVHNGVLCIARCSNNCWYRGEVQEILNDEEVVVSFHDYGDSETCRLNDLLEPLPWMMLLPYQALLCSLAGLGPTLEEWSPKAQCVLEDFGYDDNNFNRVLCLRVARKRAGDQPGTSHYEVFLFNSCSSERIGASDVLVMQGLAVPTEVPKLDFDISVPHESAFQKEDVLQQSESDDDDEWATSDDKKQKKNELSSLSNALREILMQAPSEDETACNEAENESATELLHRIQATVATNSQTEIACVLPRLWQQI
ncbi:putative ATP-dependent RNA helicase TDRD12 [Rhipicephalus sanguineus]|uniref:putative ATP-dependent RNA helicase TDRD12 n=1 Tax=Rhipicephalus sanguineus TaxID=34632 RepID=UPI0020C22C0C|nr:putative ATP-dependent RNA helicase TDRD12 [Rhipicephalus sanguineus]